ncbi:MAG: serine protein kinase PrkA [Spirochaetes bacterium]|nr:serine protein kinase PrkA [Spirochaetota bacterium]
MSDINTILDEFDKNLREENPHITIPFTEYLELLSKKPKLMLRDIFQLVHDMVHYYVPVGEDEYPEDPESIHYVKYDFYQLFIKGSDNPFFADRLFGNRFMNLINSFDHVAERNKLYFFEGPPGSGKSTFLKNFLYRFERYMRKEEGLYYETVWQIDRSRFMMSNDFLLKSGAQFTTEAFAQSLMSDGATKEANPKNNPNFHELLRSSNFIEVPCPKHDHPILQIPKAYRKQLLYDVIPDENFKQQLFNERKYKWLFKDEPCTICSSIYEVLLDKFGSPLEVLKMITPRRMRYNRRLGEGVSVYNPGDDLNEKPVKNPALQNVLDNLFKDSNKVKYIHSNLAKTNNGIFVIMDVKQNNTNRVLNLHGVISDGIHKVENIEENISSFFMGLINPQDKKFIEETKSLKDRIVYIKMPYILDYQTEVQIYLKNFGVAVKDRFLPFVLNNFSKVIIASRLNRESKALKEWIGNSEKYSKYCDANLLLLKMDIYSGIIPDWITEEDRRKFKAEIRKKIMSEGEFEGISGFTGRESISIFNDFYSLYSKKDNMITMEMVFNYFTKYKKDLLKKIPDGFLESLVSSYDYMILQQVKESIYSYNKKQIASNIQNYIFAVNFDVGSVEKCKYTNQIVEITENFFKSIEDYLIGSNVSENERTHYRDDILQKYISHTVTELAMDNKKKLIHTDLYKELHDRYTKNLKTNALDPFLKNENFRNAIKEYHTQDFSSHDRKIKRDVTLLIRNLMRHFYYSEEGAKEVCIYVIDKQLATVFKNQE